MLPVRIVAIPTEARKPFAPPFVRRLWISRARRSSDRRAPCRHCRVPLSQAKIAAFFYL